MSGGVCASQAQVCKVHWSLWANTKRWSAGSGQFSLSRPNNACPSARMPKSRRGDEGGHFDTCRLEAMADVTKSVRYLSAAYASCVSLGRRVGSIG